MAKKIATLYAEISGDTSKLDKSLVDTKSKLGGIKSGLSDTVRSVTGLDLSTLGAAAAVGLLAKGMQASIAAASNMSETVNKTQVVFGNASDKVLQFGEDAALSMGMSKQTALDAAATFGNLFVSMKIGEDQSAAMSTGLVKLAGDLASFNNIDPTIALEKLRAGMVGEVEPLRTLGVNLTAAAVDARVLAMGLDTSTEAAATASKAQARYALILEQTRTAQGDFARTSGGLANQQRILEAQLADTSAELGKNLLPTYLELVKTLNSAIISTNLLLTTTDKIKATMAEHNTVVLRTAKTYAEYQTEIERVNKAVIESLPIWTQLDLWLKGSAGDTEKLALQTRLLSEAEWNARASAEASDKALMAHAPTAKTVVAALQEEGNAAAQVAQEMKNIWLQANGATQESLNFGSAVNDLRGATDKLKAAQAEFGQSLAQDVKAELEQAGIKGDDLILALQTLDTQFGTNMVERENYKTAIQDIVKEYQKTGDLEDFRIGVQEIGTAFQDMEEPIRLAKEEVIKTKDALKELTSQEWTINIKTNFSGNVPDIPKPLPNNPINSSGKSAGSNAGAAAGADFIVPSGYPGDSFNLGVTSGERVVVTPAGGDNKDKSPKISIVVNINGGMTDKQTAEKYARYTADAINRRLK